MTIGNVNTCRSIVFATFLAPPTLDGDANATNLRSVGLQEGDGGGGGACERARAQTGSNTVTIITDLRDLPRWDLPNSYPSPKHCRAGKPSLALARLPAPFLGYRGAPLGSRGTPGGRGRPVLGAPQGGPGASVFRPPTTASRVPVALPPLQASHYRFAGSRRVAPLQASHYRFAGSRRVAPLQASHCPPE